MHERPGSWKVNMTSRRPGRSRGGWPSIWSWEKGALVRKGQWVGQGVVVSCVRLISRAGAVNSGAVLMWRGDLPLGVDA